ncbi:MAG: helix-turn-helix transcriptional regulator [Polynucleobacter sp.]
MDRTERFYKIQKMLSDRKLVTTEQFLKELEISRATFRRDLEYLRDRLGAPIAWDTDLGGYILQNIPGENLSALPGLWLNEFEIHSLLSVIELLRGIDPEGLIGSQVNPIRERLEKLLEKGDYSAREVSRRIRVTTLARRNTPTKFFEIVAHGLLARKRLQITHYGRQDNKLTEREISPQRLVYYRDNWYLDAFCHNKDDLRTFGMDALEAVTLLDKPAVSIEEADLRAELESGYGIFAGTKHQIAKLKFSPFRSRWVAKEVWHPDQKGEIQDDGSFILSIPYSDERELLLDILRQGADVEVLGPKPLRDAIKTRLMATMKIYD